MKVRAALLLALLGTLAVAAFVLLRGRSTGPQPPAPADVASAEREQRVTPVREVAPSPLPTSLPLVGPEGVGPDGYPLRYVDRPALRSLLWHRKFDDLTRYMTELQDAFEADPRRELWPNDAADAFATADPALRPILDEWGGASAGSFAPLLARGVYLVNVGFARRGARQAANTPASDVAAMDEAMRAARADLDRALALRPRLLTAMRHLMRAAIVLGAHDDVERIAARAAEACPACFVFRGTYEVLFTPRWGGSYEKMAAFARAADPAKNPRFKLLEGYVDLDRADVARRAGKLDEAEAAIARALALGEDYRFLERRAEIREGRSDPQGALADLDRALELRPGDIDLLFDRARVLFALKRSEDAGKALLAGLRVDATHHEGRRLHAFIVKGLDREGWEHHKAGRREDALRVYDLAADLAPNDGAILGHRSAIVLGAAPDIPALEAAAKREPDDFRAHQALDHALAKKGQTARVVEMWTEYLARNPKDARAYLERGGAHFQLRRREQALADVARACELGSTEACAREKQLGGGK